MISQIYQGKITEWNDPAITALNPNAMIPSLPIVTVHRSDSSGDTFIFTRSCPMLTRTAGGPSIGYGTSVAFPSHPEHGRRERQRRLVSGCPQIAGCIAYIGVSYLARRRQRGSASRAGNESGHPEPPTAATIPAESQELASITPANETLSMIYDKAPGGYPIVNYEYGIIPPKEPTPIPPRL